VTVPQRDDGATEPVRRPGSLLERLARVLGHRETVVFEPSTDPTLNAFAELFADSGLTAFTATKQARVDALTLVYDCWTESTRGPGNPPETFSVAWSPNRQGTDPLVGFRTGEDSLFFGTAPTVAMPQDERTDALLLLVTSRFVHLSAEQDHPLPVVRGIVDTGDDDYRFLTLEPEGPPS
jgi:hypothetical protein